MVTPYICTRPLKNGERIHLNGNANPRALSGGTGSGEGAGRGFQPCTPSCGQNPQKMQASRGPSRKSTPTQQRRKQQRRAHRFFKRPSARALCHEPFSYSHVMHKDRRSINLEAGQLNNKTNQHTIRNASKQAIVQRTTNEHIHGRTK